MKVKFTPKRIVLLLFACVAIILAVLACVPTSLAQAYTGQSGNMSSVALHTDTLADSVSSDTPAITVLAMGEATSAEPPICEDFIVNRSFGFILTDKNDVTLFSGVVNNL